MLLSEFDHFLDRLDRGYFYGKIGGNRMQKKTLKTIGASAVVISMVGLMHGTGTAQAASQTTTQPQTPAAVQSEKSVHVTVRVEGYGNLHVSRQVTVGAGTYLESDGSALNLEQPTVLGALLKALDISKHTYVVKQTQYGPYVTAIDNEKEKDMNSNTGWSFWLNGEPLQVGADQQTIKDGDTIVCGFYDFSKTLYPKFTVSADSVSKGSPVTVTLSAEQTSYDANWNPTTKEVKVQGAVVHFGNQTAITDANGQVTIKPNNDGNLLVYADEYDKDGLPLLIPTAVQTIHVHEQTTETLKDQNQVDYASQAIADLASKSVIVGDGNGYYYPTRLISRAELAAMTVVATHAPASGSPLFYHDIDSKAWYAPYLQVAVANGLLAGDSANMMRPNATLTREELSAILVHAAGLDQEVQSANTSDLALAFHDAANVDGWAKAYVEVAYTHHLMNGIGGNRFAPKSFVSRAEAAVAIENLLQNQTK
jgi:Domain of unknown function (DUF4430)/S-layer homology domain